MEYSNNISCANCKYRAFSSWSGVDYCCDYEMGNHDAAKECLKYEKGTPVCYGNDEYTPSATAGDYSPSCPWNAPGCSINMFI